MQEERRGEERTVELTAGAGSHGTGRILRVTARNMESGKVW